MDVPMWLVGIAWFWPTIVHDPTRLDCGGIQHLDVDPLLRFHTAFNRLFRFYHPPVSVVFLEEKSFRCEHVI